MDDQEPQVKAFIPLSAPGTLPDEWNGTDGFVANAIVPVVTTWSAPPGAHTVKVSGEHECARHGETENEFSFGWWSRRSSFRK